MKNILVILILLSAQVCTFSQVPSSKTDSLKRALELSATDDYEGQIRILRQLYEFYLVNDLPAALSTAKKQHLLAVKLDNDTARLRAEMRLGYVYYNQGKNDSSLFFFNKALESLKT
jgi:tetratricopeptide (TPR) repeat protein